MGYYGYNLKRAEKIQADTVCVLINSVIEFHFRQLEGTFNS